MISFPLQQKYELKINIKKRVLFFNKSKTILIMYKEATVLEVIEFLQSKGKIVEYFSEFILKNSNANKEDLWEILLSFDKISTHLNNTYLKWLWDTKKDKPIETTEEDNKTSENWWFSSYIAILTEKLSIDPLNLLWNYTLAQFNYLTEWITYNSNESTKKWQQENRMNNIKKKRENLNDKDAQKIKDFIYSD